MKVYISGPITGDDFYMRKFQKAEEGLRSEGHEPVNPTTVYKEGTLTTYKEYIDADIDLLKECDAIYMLKGWENSKGAKVERQYAMTTGMWIAYQ